MRRLSLVVALALAACSKPAPSPPDLTPFGRFVPVSEAKGPPLPPPEPKPDTPIRPALACPPEMALVPAVNGCIDRYEASSGGGSLGAPDGKGTTIVARSLAGKRPLADVTYGQARQACLNAGKRLCLDDEWRIACSGKRTKDGSWSYAYGSTYEEKRCFDWHASDHGRKPPLPTGSLPRCVTPAGVFDLANNVAELTDGGKAGQFPTHGGSVNHVQHDSSCEETLKVSATDHYPTVGFRCCSDGLPPAPPAK